MLVGSLSKFRCRREVSMATLGTGTTPACSHQLAPSQRKRFSGSYSLNPILTNAFKWEGGVGAGLHKGPLTSGDQTRSAQSHQGNDKPLASNHLGDFNSSRKRPLSDCIGLGPTLSKWYSRLHFIFESCMRVVLLGQNINYKTNIRGL